MIPQGRRGKVVKPEQKPTPLGLPLRGSNTHLAYGWRLFYHDVSGNVLSF